MALLGGCVRYAVFSWLAVPAVVLISAGDVHAQGSGAPTPPRPAPVQTGRAAALDDLTGSWVSVVTEDWMMRMIVPDKGDDWGIPVSAAGKKVAAAWDPAKDVAAGEQCKSYGAAGIMRIPGRLHISWQDDNTLRVDVDSGSQTRLLHFAGTPPSGTEPGWQGYSVASWFGQVQMSAAGGGRATGRGTLAQGTGQLKVITTHMRPGYLRKNGIPYSASSTLEEYFDRFTAPNGDTVLVLTSILTDPEYLFEPYITNVHFKKIPDRSGWDPTPCRADEAR